MLKSPALVPFFENVEMDRLIEHQIHFLSKVLGGPDNYNGLSLVDAHKDLGITDSAFNEVSQHLVASLEDASVEANDIDEIVKIIGSVKGEIVIQ